MSSSVSVRTLVATLIVGVALAAAAPGFAYAASALSGPTSFLSLADAWALAEEHHPRIVEARRSMLSLERDLQQRENAYAPTVTVSADGLSARLDADGWQETVNPQATVRASMKLPSGLSLNATMTTPGLSQRTGGRSNWRGSVSLDYPLFRSAELDGDALALRQAELSLISAQREFEQLRDEVRAEVLAALHAAQTAKVRLDLAKESYADAVAEWETVQRQREFGIVTEAEFITAQVNMLRAEQDRLVAERTAEARRRELAGLLGLDDVSAYEFEDVLSWTTMPPPGDVDEAVERAVANSMTVWERRQAVETAALQLAAERERSGLTAQLSGSYVPPGSATQNNQPGLTVAVSLSYPLADGGQRRAALEAREEALVRAEEALAQAIEDVQARVVDLFTQLEDARRDVEIAALELTRAELELEVVRRQAGLPVPTADHDAVERARRALVRAELSRLEAVQRFQARWVELQVLKGPVPWDMLVDSAVALTPADGEAWAEDGEGTQ